MSDSANTNPESRTTFLSSSRFTALASNLIGGVGIGGGASATEKKSAEDSGKEANTANTDTANAGNVQSVQGPADNTASTTPPTGPLPLPQGKEGGNGGQPRLKIDTSQVKNGEVGSELDYQNPQDSLSLLQLKKYVAEGVRPKQPEYSYTYTDTDPLPEELSEWFSYLPQELELLLHMKTTFEARWQKFCERLHPGERVYNWRNTAESKRRSFIIRCVEGLESANQIERVEALEALAYVVVGVFGDTTSPDDQLLWIRENTLLAIGEGAFDAAYQVFRGAMGREWENYLEETEDLEKKQANYIELRNSLTVMYFLLEVLRREDTRDKKAVEEFREEILSLEPNFLVFLVKTVARTRWDEIPDLPLLNILLLVWKTSLLVFGSPTQDLPAVKAYARKKAGLSEKVDKDTITASPLDYHLFRQEVIAKYPAYNPPQTLLPLENDNNSILPPLRDTYEAPGRGTGVGTDVNSAAFSGNQSSIMNQPVHIATPVPSPPPSPAVGNQKGVKKQNYQTNQSFPFMYPPENFETTVSNKFSQNAWWKVEGADEEGGVPTSIKEAGELFSKRIRMTLALKQLWEEREEFMRHERGWAPLNPTSSMITDEECIEQKRLNAVEEFYSKALPHLQSFIIVLLKSIIATFPPPPNPPNRANSGPGQGPMGQQQPVYNENGMPNEQQNVDQPSTLENIDKERRSEIIAKVVTAIILVFLKWFRVSHVLKFEYLTQLLLDASYIHLLLKTLQTQEPALASQATLEFRDLSFFVFCNAYSAVPMPRPGDESPDDSAPPPIKRTRTNTNPQQSATVPLGADGGTETQPSSPTHIIHEYSSRLFFTYINYLRIAQKIVKGKTHRNLMLVQFKSSQALRKPLAKLPQDDLRLYTLKLFKGQVPYCGRKWRQGHMRFITAIYLHCRPQLRDDWLAGTDVDSDVEDAMGRENSLRSLTQFYNYTRYPKAMQPVNLPEEGEVLLEEERDFFARELEKMEINGAGEFELLDDEGGWGPDLPGVSESWG